MRKLENPRWVLGQLAAERFIDQPGTLQNRSLGRQMLALICRELEPKLKGIMADFFNPRIRVTALKAPPRTDYKDCCCQWEYELD
jgi:hypothetical protein